MFFDVRNFYDRVADEYLDALDPDHMPSMSDMCAEVLCMLQERLLHEPYELVRLMPIPLKDIPNECIAKLIAATHTLAYMTYAEIRESDPKWNYHAPHMYRCEAQFLSNAYPVPIAAYVSSGDDEGLYRFGEKYILDDPYFEHWPPKRKAELLSILEHYVPIRNMNTDKNLVAVKNGIFDIKNRALMPFTPEIVFFSKSSVDYVENPDAPVIHSDTYKKDWTVDGWLSDLAGTRDTDENTNMLWECLHMALCPAKHWEKALLLCGAEYAGHSFFSLLRSLLGSACAELPMKELSKPKSWFGLPYQQAVLSDVPFHKLHRIYFDGFRNAIVRYAMRIYRATFTREFYWQGVQVLYSETVPTEHEIRYRNMDLIHCLVLGDPKWRGAYAAFVRECLNRQDVLEYIQYRALAFDSFS